MNNLSTPLAHFLKPKTISEIIGQDSIVGKDTFLFKAIANDQIPSMIFYGPSGVGKTSLAMTIAEQTNSDFLKINAVSAGIADIKKIIIQAQENKQQLFDKKTILFIDEIHRFNKKQQDFLLPFVEDGTITLIGATTENPSFEVNSALLSRVKVFVFNRLSDESLLIILENAQKKLLKLNNAKKGIAKKYLKLIANSADGDARIALNLYELVLQELKNGHRITKEIIESILSQKILKYDKNGQEHYNTISALHKSMRNSDPNASAYWAMRMLEAGEDPKYIVRRMIRFASEDIGNADPQALILANAVQNTVHFLGMPECNTAVVQLATYLALAPKNNSSYVAVCDIQEDIKKYGSLPVPDDLKNAVTGLDEKMGYGKNMKYIHNSKEQKINLNHLPEKLKNKKYYKNSFERKKEGKKDLW